MSYSQVFFYCSLSFLGGIFLNSFLKIPQPTILLFLILALISILLRPFKKLLIINLCIFFLFLGIRQHGIAESKIINNKLRKFNDSPEALTLAGRIIKEPTIRENNLKLEFLVESLNSEPISGKILIITRKYSTYHYGDRLKITGKLKTPKEYPDFNYKDYLAKEGISSVIYYPKIELIEKNQGNFIYAKILSFKEKLRKAIYENLPPPQSSILGAMILGDKERISEKWKNKLNIAGLRHITAISGLHVALLTTILLNFFLLLGFSRGQAFYFTIFLITLFIVMTGLQPSAMRAAIMAGLFLLGQHLGRISVSSRSIVFAGTLMLLQNPLLLRFDVGFQLSFLAVMGIIYLMPIFQDWFSKWFPMEWFQKRWWLNWLPIKALGDILAITFAAQVFTLPILIYNFGYFSLIAPITNLLILPFLPFIMISGFISGIVGIVSGTLGWILSFPVWLLFIYLIKVIDLFSQPSLAKTLENVSSLWLIISYLVLGLITYRLKRKFDQPIFLK